MDLSTLWRLAAHWYDGRLEPGYVRRDPAAAADYLQGVGLCGPFWGPVAAASSRTEAPLPSRSSIVLWNLRGCVSVGL